jgi:hypothetical protein
MGESLGVSQHINVMGMPNLDEGTLLILLNLHGELTLLRFLYR